MTSREVFLSYAREDLPVAERIADALEREGFSVFLDRRRLRASGFAEQLDRAIARSDVFVLLISGWSVASTYVNRELHAAADEHGRPVLPVVVQDVDVAPFRLAIAGLQRVDFTSGTDQQLADVVDGVYVTLARARRGRPSRGGRAATAVGGVLSGVGVALCVAGMGYFFWLLAQAWNSEPGEGPPEQVPMAFGVFFAGMVVAIVGEAIRRASRRRQAWR